MEEIKKPIVSIIIATYNSEKTIRTTLASVLAQSFQGWECLVVDGASSDNTLSIIKEFCRIDERFRYISEKDNGIYDAFNKGWKLARGKWVHYLGSDDTLTIDGMRDVVAELDEAYTIVTGDVYLLREDGTSREQQYKGYFGCHQGVIMQRKAIEAFGGFDEQYRILADYDLMVRNYKEGNKVKNVRFFIAFFYVGGESQKLSSQWKKMLERYRINKRYEMMKFPFLSSFEVFVRHSLLYILRSYKGGKK